MKKAIRMLLALLMVAAFLTGCAGSGDKGAIKIMLFTTLTGDMAAGGEMDKMGAELAVKHINEAGGVMGRTLELVVVDATSDSTQAPLILENALSKGGITCVIGSNSSSIFKTELAVLEKYKVPGISGGVSMEICTQGYTYVFREACNAEDLAESNMGLLLDLVEVSGKTIDEFNVAIIYEDSNYGQDTGSEYQSILNEAGFNVAINENWPAGQLTDASSLVTKLIQAKVDLVMSVAYPSDTKLILNTMASMSYKPLIIGGGSGFIWPTLEEEMGDDVNGIISASAWNWDSTCNYKIDNWQEIVDDYVKTNGVFMAEQAGECYGFVRAAAFAIEKAESTDPVEVRNTIAGLTTENCEWLALVPPGTGGGFDATGEYLYAVGTTVQWQGNVPRTIWPREISGVEVQ